MATYRTAKDEFVEIDGIKFAYRRLGVAHGVPLLLIMHYRGTMDHWDPALVDALAAARPVLLADNAGVGRSQGQVPETFTGWARHYVDILRALGVDKADVLGFSMGGCVAQLVALNAPRLVRRLILCGTIPSAGPGVVRAPPGPFNQLRNATTEAEQRGAFLATFFADTPNSQAAGVAAWERITHSRASRVGYVPRESAHRQGVAFANFMDPRQADAASYSRLGELKLPVLIANGKSASPACLGYVGQLTADTGSNDVLLPTSNSVTLWEKISHEKAQLHLYPDSGHGFLYQYAPQFAKLINSFLDDDEDTADSVGDRRARL